MSNDAITAVLARSRSKGSARLIMFILADYANEEGTAWPSTTTLAKKANMTKRNVLKTLSKLETENELTRIGKGIRGVIKYHITVVTGELQDTSEPTFTSEPRDTPTGEPHDTSTSEPQFTQSLTNPLLDPLVNPPTPLEWGDFVNAYPDRGGLEKDLGGAEKIFIKLVSEGISPAEIVKGLKGYALAVSVVENKKYVLKATSFLKKETWKEYLKDKPVSLIANGAAGEGWEEVLTNWSDQNTAQAWLYPLMFDGIKNGLILLTAKSEFCRERCQKFEPEILAAFKLVNPGIHKIKITAMQERT